MRLIKLYVIHYIFSYEHYDFILNNYLLFNSNKYDLYQIQTIF